MHDNKDPHKAVGPEALLTSDGATFRVALDMRDRTLLAGGLAQVTLSIEVRSGTVRLWVAGDRMTGRPAGLGFTAELDGFCIPQLYPNARNRGGPAGEVLLTPDAGWSQRVDLNAFLRLEDARQILQPGQSGQLRLICRSRLLASGLEVVLRTECRVLHDDAALAAQVKAQVSLVRRGPIEQRAEGLEALVLLRAPPARAIWRELAADPDRYLADRARHALRE